MGQKYMIYGFNYGDKFKHMRQTDWLIVAMFWSLVYGIKYDGVDISNMVLYCFNAYGLFIDAVDADDEFQYEIVEVPGGILIAYRG